MADINKAVNDAKALAQQLAQPELAGGDFAKSLTTGNQVVTPGTDGGAAFRRQDLASDVINLTWGDRDFTIFNLIPRVRAASTAYEYTVQTGYGEFGSSRFVPEMEIASINDIAVERKFAPVKIISDTRQASLLSMQVDNITDPMDRLTEASMLTVAKTIEYGIFYGDADMSGIGAGQGYEFDGWEKLVDPANILDNQGRVLTEQDLNAAAVKIAENFGRADSAFMPVGVQASFVQNQLGRQWVTQGTAENVNSGFNVPKFYSAQGAIDLYPSTITRLDKILNLKKPVSYNAPAAPAVTATVATGAGKFQDADLLATAKYAVVIQSDGSGDSAATLVEATVSDKKQEVTLDVNLGVQIIGKPRNIAVYRLDAFSNTYFLVGRVPFYKATNTAGSFHLKFVDKNETIPGTAEVFIGSMDKNVLALAELDTMTRLPLATVKASVQFTVLWQGTMALFAPAKVAMIKNVKGQVF